MDDTADIVSRNLLPSEATATAQFKQLMKYWKTRNRFIRDMRDMHSGLNKIEAPSSTMYVVKTLHSYVVAAMMNEKASRYLSRPVVQVVPDDDIDDEGRAKSTRIERGVNIGGYEIERKVGGDSWDRAVLDSLLIGMGIQRIQRVPNKYWKKITEHDYAVKDGKKPEMDLSLNSPARVEYKKEMGVPFFKEYVPLEFYYPFFDGQDMPFAYELEEKSKWSVLNDPVYKGNEFGAKALRGMEAGPDGGLDETVNIVQLANNGCRAYYLAGPGPNSGNNKWPKLRPTTVTWSGELQLLYAYEHDLGRSEYNHLNGRTGGWYTDKNRIEEVGRGILELAQAADDILSQVLTNVRARYWPNLNYKMDPEARGFGTGNSKPEAPKIKEGESIVSFIKEEIVPIFTGTDDPMAMWLWDTIQQQISKLVGSSVLYGQRAPGVDTGYNQAIQQTQAESLDNKQEQHIQAGAEEEALIICLHTKRINEPVYMHYTEEYTAPITGKKTKVGKYVILDPKDLTPMPRFSARVRKQRPVDYIAALRAAREASDDRGGKGPLLSDDTIREEILAVEGPDIEYQKILLEAAKRELVASGTINNKVAERLNIKIATTGVPEISPEMLQNMDPALVQAIQGSLPAAAGEGGVDPDIVGGTMGVGTPGPLPGDAMPENRLGEAISMASQTGAAI